MLRKCKHCSEKSDNPYLTPLFAFCNVDHALKYSQTQIQAAHAKKQKKIIKRIAEEKKACRKDLLELNKKTLGWQHKQTKVAFNKMRVLQELKWFHDRGLAPSCISCSKQNMDWCCGHFKTVGSSPELRYKEYNTYLQCNRYCNRALSGNIEGNKTTRGYKEGLKERFGVIEGEAIIKMCESKVDLPRLRCEELEEIRKVFNKNIKNLQSGIH
ncbi:MAG: recombination protein NinG [Thiotrichaceae bacterium]